MTFVLTRPGAPPATVVAPATLLPPPTPPVTAPAPVPVVPAGSPANAVVAPAAPEPEPIRSTVPAPATSCSPPPPTAPRTVSTTPPPMPVVAPATASAATAAPALSQPPATGSVYGATAAAYGASAAPAPDGAAHSACCPVPAPRRRKRTIAGSGIQPAIRARTVRRDSATTSSPASIARVRHGWQ